MLGLKPSLAEKCIEAGVSKCKPINIFLCENLTAGDKTLKE